MAEDRFEGGVGGDGVAGRRAAGAERGEAAAPAVWPDAHPVLARRDFLKLLGGGILILFTVPGGPFALAEAQRRRSYPTDPNAYLHIAADGSVTVYTGKIEMGQGVVTSLAQMAAEELGVALEVVRMVMGDTDLCPWDMGTFGSMSTPYFGPALRAAAAEARAVLMSLAAERLQAREDELVLENGIVFLRADRSKWVAFGQLAAGEKIARRVAGEARLTPPGEFHVMGKPVWRRDAVEKVTGRAIYAGDVRAPGMLYARVLRPPAHGATLKRVDVSAAERMPGVRIVEENDLLAVLHEDPEQAAKALESVRAEYEVPKPAVDHTSIFAHLVSVAPPAEELDPRGDLAAGAGKSRIVIEQRYLNGYVAHAPIETHTALARSQDGKMTVWPSTQTPFPTQERIARALDLDPGDVRVITPFVGGGFGGKSAGLQAEEAARLAAITGRPVQVAWTRAEEFFYDTFRPAAVVDVRSGVDQAGKIAFWDYAVYFAGSRGTDQYYDVPNNRIRVHGEWMGDPAGAHPFAVGPWRAPGANTNTFAKESQIDTMASRAAIDPLEFRLHNLSAARMLRVLRAAAERFGWKSAVAPSGRGYGIACGIDAGTYVATMAEVEVERETGRVRVKRVVCAQDMGIVVNPEGATIQMEGCVMMGLGYALAEEVRFEGGNILDRNFDTYALPRFSWLPEIETFQIRNDELAPQGGGEPAITGMGAVVANAIFDATGARLLQLPMTPERVLAAMKG